MTSRPCWAHHIIPADCLGRATLSRFAGVSAAVGCCSIQTLGLNKTSEFVHRRNERLRYLRHCRRLARCERLLKHRSSSAMQTMCGQGLSAKNSSTSLQPTQKPGLSSEIVAGVEKSDGLALGREKVVAQESFTLILKTQPSGCSLFTRRPSSISFRPRFSHN